MRRSLRDAFKNPKTAYNDFLVLTASAVVILALALYFDAFDLFARWYVTQEEPFELEEILVVIFFLSIGFAIFAFRRWKELVLEVRERQEIEKALVEQSESLKILLDTLPNPVFYTDTDGRCTGCNKAFEDFTGRRRQDIVGEDLREFGLSAAAAAGNGSEAGQDPDKHGYESIVRNGGGELRNILFHEAGLANAEGRTTGAVGIMTDVTELKKVQLALAGEAIRHRILFEQSRDGIVVLDQSGKVWEANEKYAEMLRYTPEEVRLLHVWDWDDQWTREELQEQIRLIDAAGAHFETQHRRKDGTLFDVEISTNGAMFDDQKLIFCVCRDISERKSAERALQEREEIYRAIVNQAADSIVLIDSETLRFAEFNDAACTGLGYTREEFSEITLFDLQTDMTPEELVSLVRTVVQEGYGHFESRQRCKDGSLRDVHISKRALRIRGRDYLAAIWHDVTRQKRSEQALQKSEARLQLALAASHLGVWEWNIQTDTVFWSPQCYKIFELEPSDSRVESFTSMLHPEDASRLRKAVDTALSDRSVQTVEYRIIHPGGQIRWIHSLGQAYFDDSDKPLRLAGIIQDITENKRAQDEKVKLETQLFHAQKMESIGRLAGGVAHDFNNMLGVIIGHTDLILDEMDSDDPLYADLMEIRNAADHSADLTRQLLAFARKQTVSPKVLDLNDTISGMLKMLRRLIGEDIELLWSPGHDPWLVKIDPSQIDQILANMVVNARDAISGVGSIRLKTENITVDASHLHDTSDLAPGEYVLLTADDTGAGMDEEILDHIFEPFFTTKDVGRGTGLGLATIYGIVKQNDGFIAVDSAPGLGTTFRIYLPRYTPGAGEESPWKPKVKSSGGNETVLLVEDDRPMLNLAQKMLRSLGYTVLAAGTPGEAIRLAGEPTTVIDLLITDVVMPEMNGKDLVGRLHAIRPGLRFFYISGHTADVVAHRGIMEPGVHILNKPFSREDLAEKIKTVLKKD